MNRPFAIHACIMAPRAAPALLVGCCILASGGCSPTPHDRLPRVATGNGNDAPSPELFDAAGLGVLLDSVFAKGMAEEHIPGAVFVMVKDGAVVIARGYGVADVESRRPVDPTTTIFPIASISKVFTATAVMQLTDRGLLDLHADVNRYLISTQVPNTYPQPITTADLLSHTSGLDELPGRRARTAADVVPLGAFLGTRLIRVHAPGEVTSYSSFGMALAGLLVTEISGEPFETYLSRNVWHPLGMDHTWITVPASQAANLATAYEVDDGREVRVPYEVYNTPPTSSIVSTAKDMARFMVAHLQRGRYGSVRILSDTAAALMQQQHATMHPRIPGWAYGFQVDDANGRRILVHGGDIGGFSTLMVLLPDDRLGFYVAHHIEGANLRFAVEQSILDRYFPDRRPLEIVAPRKENAERLRRFAGTYRANIFCHSCPDGGPNVQDFEVTASGDGTITVWDQRWEPVEALYFTSLDGHRHIGFKENADGHIVALTAGSWRVLERIR